VCSVLAILVGVDVARLLCFGVLLVLVKVPIYNRDQAIGHREQNIKTQRSDMKVKLEFEKWNNDDTLTRAFWDRGHVYAFPSLPCSQLRYLIGQCCGIIVPRHIVEFVLDVPIESLIPSWCDSNCSYSLSPVGDIEIEKRGRKLSVHLHPEVEIGDLALVLRFPRGFIAMYRENGNGNGRCSRVVRVVGVRSDGSFVESVVRI